MAQVLILATFITAIHQSQAGDRLRQTYARLCDTGTKPPMAKLTIARKIAARVLAMWKNKEAYNPVT